jgi:cytochrome c oxidase subunit 2
MQSAFDPHGPGAQDVLTLSWVMFAGGWLIVVLVGVLTAYAMLAPPARRRWLAGAPAIVAGGIVFPVLVLSALLVYGSLLGSDLIAAERGALRIRIIGEQWWWRVRYLDDAGRPLFDTANELHLPEGRPVELLLESADVIHSFWAPSLGGKIDLIPGRVNRLRLQADKLGVLRGQCAEYCGGPHALMAFHVVVETAAQFDEWIANQRTPAREPEQPLLVQGRERFMSAGCLACHTIRGTGAFGIHGPDLTHVGSRLSIGAGNFPNDTGTLAVWIADSRHLKPGNHMPPFAASLGADLVAVASYLESLK